MHICSKRGFVKRKLQNILIVFSAVGIVFLTSSVGRASSFDPYLTTQTPLQEYYTIEETQAAFTAPQATDMSPWSHVDLQELTEKARTLALNLLNWTLHPEAPAMPQEKYQRQHHFGRWINDPTDDTCYNTRAKVLIRDSEGPVSFKEKNHCLVEKGDWADPYAGDIITESKDIQIDHMVPLKHAYMTGAWAWDYQTRCIYANFMGNKFHLITANGRENMRKGDKAPDQYLPPNQAYLCEYLENWLKIKLIWQLKMTPTEVSAIRRTFEENNCELKDFTLSQRELKHQRTLIHVNNELCPAR